jgi:hypothetical protein
MERVYIENNANTGEKMTTESTPTEQAEKKMNVKFQGGSSDTVYSMGLIGAWVYYIGRATTSKERILGFFKGFVWPAVLVYELLKYFKATL